jgi:hypothetical protein
MQKAGKPQLRSHDVLMAETNEASSGPGAGIVCRNHGL